jgi:hypothetical protein
VWGLDQLYRYPFTDRLLSDLYKGSLLIPPHPLTLKMATSAPTETSQYLIAGANKRRKTSRHQCCWLLGYVRVLYSGQFPMWQDKAARLHAFLTWRCVDVSGRELNRIWPAPSLVLGPDLLDFINWFGRRNNVTNESRRLLLHGEPNCGCSCSFRELLVLWLSCRHWGWSRTLEANSKFPCGRSSVYFVNNWLRSRCQGAVQHQVFDW